MTEAEDVQPGQGQLPCTFGERTQEDERHAVFPVRFPCASQDAVWEASAVSSPLSSCFSGTASPAATGDAQIHNLVL
jgi:hypothetical protein